MNDYSVKTLMDFMIEGCKGIMQDMNKFFEDWEEGDMNGGEVNASDDPGAMARIPETDGSSLSGEAFEAEIGSEPDEFFPGPSSIPI